MPATPFNLAVIAAELVLLLSGLVLLWRLVLVRRGRAAAPSPTLAPLTIAPSEFLLGLLVVIGGALVGMFISSAASRSFHASEHAATVFASAGFQLGMLAGAAVLPLQLGRSPLRALFTQGGFLSGVVVFLIAQPIITVVNIASLWGLTRLGISTEQQDLLRLFLEIDRPALLIVMLILATLVAPVAEELLFRGAIFRYLRTRVPHWLALLVPAVLFAALHGNWVSFAPLVVLAAIYSLGYERTGRIATPIVAHACFNLHTVLLLFSGVMDEAPTSF